MDQFLFFFQIYQLFSQRFSYFMSATNIVELALYTLAVLSVYEYEADSGSKFYGVKDVRIRAIATDIIVNCWSCDRVPSFTFYFSAETCFRKIL